MGSSSCHYLCDLVCPGLAASICLNQIRGHVCPLWVIKEFSVVLLSLLPTIGFGDTFAVLSPGVWSPRFLPDSVGAPMLLSAFVTRFLIRRIPVIG